ncbi:MAG: LpqB family beta-propeller domain-containing protein [Acidobacteriota bacterium]
MNSGNKFGRYEIRQKIGAGGMGEVFLARDEELERDVALKFLPAEFSADAERLSRFKQEARAASALNHPNILTIYEVGEIAGRAFIATEFIDGETLREKISRNDLTIVESVKIAGQIVSALAVAHAAHIVHRDIKPENIMIRADGYVKILDFGLAKPAARQSGEEDKTLPLVQTQDGMVLGSVRYMSPEQARGKIVDERTDVWSVGVVLYEMVTGCNPFDGETVSDSLAALIHVEPAPLDEFIDDAPEELSRIIRKTLKKKADERYQNIKDLALDLKELRYNLEHGNSAIDSTRSLKRFDSGENATLLIENADSANFRKTRKTGENAAAENFMGRRRSILPFIFVFIALAGIIAFGVWLAVRGKKPPRFEGLEISKISDAAGGSYPTISPDGKYIAYINSENGKRTLAVRQTATGSVVQIAESPVSGRLQLPVFAPDGDYVYYLILDNGVGNLYQTPTLGGTAKKIIADVDSKVAVAPDGKKIAFVRNNAETDVMSVIVANADGSNEEIITDSKQLQVKSVNEISWSPTENKLLFAADEIGGDESVKSKLLIFSLADKTSKVFGERNWFGVSSIFWTKDGANILLVGGSNEQEPAQIWEIFYPNGDMARRITNDANGYVMMSLASDAGTIVGMKQDVISSVWMQNQATKEQKQLIAENKLFVGSNTLLPMSDGRILINKSDNDKSNLFTVSNEGKDEKSLTEGDAFNSQAALSPDGQTTVFTRNRSGIWRMKSNGENIAQLTKPENAFDSNPLILPDNKTVIFARRLSDLSKSVLMKIPIEGGVEPEMLFSETEKWGSLPRLSPDGKHFAYTTLSYNRGENKYNRTVRITAVSGGEIGKLEKETDEKLGWNYHFTTDGKNLTYINAQNIQNLYNFPLDGSPRKQITNFNSGIILNFAWSQDGKKLYIVRGIISNELVLLKNSE